MKNALLKPFHDDTLVVNLGENIPLGADWQGWIKSTLGKSDLLLLLLNDPGSDLDWCLYEAGLFAGLPASADNRRAREVVFICPPGKNVPRTLGHLQGVEGSAEGIKEFLRRLYRTNAFGCDPPLIDWVDKGVIDLTDLTAGVLAAINAEVRVAANELRRDDRVLGERDDAITSRAVQNEPYIFVSHHHKDNGFISSLCDRMRDRGIKHFRYDKSVKAGADHVNEVHENVKLASHLMVIVSPASLESQWVWYEVGYAKGNQKTVVPYVIDQAVSKPSFIALNRHIESDTQEKEFFDSLDRAAELRSELTSTKAQPVTSFDELIDELERLIRTTEPDDSVKMLAFTPALGFLAKPEKWESLKRCLSANRNKIQITCLDKQPLKRWHELFVGRRNDFGLIDKALTDEATRVAEELLAGLTVTRLDFLQMPDFYAFSNARCAILVTPLFLPRLDRPDAKDLPNVDMFGVVTNYQKVVMQASVIHGHYSGGLSRAARAN